MTAFYLSAGAMTLLALGFIVWPLFRGQQRLRSQRRAANRLIYQQRLDTIQLELDTGRLSVEQASALRDDAGRLLLGDLATADEQPSQLLPRSRRWPILLLVACLLPAMAVGVYLRSDSWLLLQHTEGEPAWSYLFHKLEKRLAIAPADTEALLMLARSRRATQDLTAAAEAYARLNSVTGFSNAEYLTDEAETRILLEEGAVSDLARQRLQQALAQQPDYGRALWYAGLGAMALGDQAAAIRHWRRLDQQELPQAFRKVLRQQLIALGVARDSLSQASEKQGQTVIQLAIEADAELVAGLPGDTPVFVMARPASGERSMLAVSKHRLSDLPLETALTDGMNMAGGPQLSSTDAWRVVVRVAPSGDALPQTGDPYGELDLTRAQINTPIRLRITRRWGE